MGICASCLGRGDHSDESPEAERLLPDEEQLSQPVYGSTDEDLLSEPDPEEVKRQQEALERICAEAASELVDVHQNSDALSSNRSRPAVAEYPTLVDKLFKPKDTVQASTNGTNAEEDEESDDEGAAWLADALKADETAAAKRDTDMNLVMKLVNPKTSGHGTAHRTSGHG